MAAVGSGASSSVAAISDGRSFSGRVIPSNSEWRYRPDVSEVYSPPRVTTMAGESDIRAGWALDFRT
eukprot:6688897-Heterocapsa_arctica.AAC.1